MRRNAQFVSDFVDKHNELVKVIMKTTAGTRKHGGVRQSKMVPWFKESCRKARKASSRAFR